MKRTVFEVIGAVLGICAILVALHVQRCSLEQAATKNQADLGAQLEQKADELAKVKTAESAEANKEKRATVQQQVEKEVADEAGDSDLLDYFDSVTGHRGGD